MQDFFGCWGHAGFFSPKKTLDGRNVRKGMPLEHLMIYNAINLKTLRRFAISGSESFTFRVVSSSI
jgi:hypothetical protein